MNTPKRNTRPKIAPVAIPVRPLVGRASLAFLFALSFALLLFSRSDNPVITSVRTTIMDVVVPFLEVISHPTQAVSDAGSWAGDLVTLREQNIALKAENARLLQWQGAAKKLDVENQALRNLLNFSAATVPSYVTARIVGDGSGPYVRAALISAGANQGVKENQAVMSDRGLIGRIVHTGNMSAQVLLLTDINSRVPVMSENSRERAILAGDNSERLELSYLPDNSHIAVGERIVTSGDGGLLPAGIPVGVVTATGTGGTFIRPLADWSRLEYVSVVEYQFGAKQ